MLPPKPSTTPKPSSSLLSQIFFHPFVAGLVLAAVLAAIMSTISSQLIVSSSALVEDLYHLLGREANAKRDVALGRAGVLVVALVAALIALDRNSSILQLVSFAWAGFGAAFGPLVLLSLYWRKLTSQGAIAGMIVATITVFAWGKTPVLHDAMYEIVPAFILNILVTVIVSRMTYKHNAVIDDEFTQMEDEVGKDATTPVNSNDDDPEAAKDLAPTRG